MVFNCFIRIIVVISLISSLVANAQSGECIDVLSKVCREQAASLAQANLTKKFPSLRVRAFGDLFVFADPELFKTQDNRTLFENGVGPSLCVFGVNKLRFESSADATLEGVAVEQYDLRCPKTGQPPPKTDAEVPAARPLSSPTQPASQSAGVSSFAPKTLGGLRNKYEGKTIIVDGAEFERGMLEWNIAKPAGSGFKGDVFNHLARSYKGKTATVMAVQLDPNSRTGQAKVNALGELVNPDDAVDPYVDVVVRFDDGTIAIKQGFPNTLQIDLASEREDLILDMEKSLPSVVGKNLYAVGWSKLYSPDATIDELKGEKEILKRLPLTQVPLLTPLVIVKAKYIAEEKAVVLKLRLPNGSEALAFTDQVFLEDTSRSKSTLSKISGTLLAQMPGFTSQEIDAIKQRELFRGMSGDAVEYALGFAETKNDWGKGGEQLVFFSGKLMVYVDNRGKIADWQNLDK